VSSPPSPSQSLPGRARLRPLWRWSERAILALVATGTGLALGLRDVAAPWTSVVFYATPPPLLVCGSLVGIVLALLQRSPKRSATWAALAVALAALTFQREVFSPGPAPDAVEAMRVLSWNLHGGRAGEDAILGAIGEVDADLICLSEVGHFRDGERRFLRGLEAQLRGRGYVLRTWPGARLIVALRAGRGELLKQTWDRAPGVARSLWVEARWRGRPLRVVLADFRSTPTLDRSPGTQRLLSRLEAGPQPWICLGDFNTPLASRCFDPWRAAGAIHAFEAAGSGYAPTWPAPLPVLTLDHLWSRGLIPLRAEAPLRSESDHCPLVVSLGWPR
jgi:vancomycin resistance protein VanJ